MSIVSSTLVSDSRQADGRRWIQERHLDQFSSEYSVMYLCPAVWDASSAMLARASQLYADKIQGEIDSNVNDITLRGSLASPTIKYSTVAANAAALREAYRSSTRTEAVMIGDYLNTLTNAQLQAAFGLTAGQVSTLRTNKLAPAATLAASIRASTGQ